MGPAVTLAPLWVLFCAVSLVTAAKQRPGRVPKTELSQPCSRILSRTVRQRFHSHVMRQPDRVKGVNTAKIWPDGCPFSPWVDIFGWHEKNKTRSKGGSQISEWVCNYTGKTFKSEHYIDLHMEKYFMEVAPENSVCLADYCEVFGFCNVKELPFFESLSAEPPPCDPKAVEAQKLTCHSVCDRCALLDDPAMPNLSAYLHKSLCEPLTCEFRAEKHHSSRKVSIVIAVCGVLVLCIIFYCVFVASPENTDRSYGRDRRSYGRDRGRKLNNAGKRFPSGSREQAQPTDIVDHIPTKPIKQE